MNQKAVHIEQVEVHRVLGIARGQGWTLDNLCPGVNVIHGPNGCGKTTTARAIHELLWPARTGLHRASVAGAYRFDGRPWRIELDAGDPACTCDGRPQAPPALGPAEHRRRYWLALDDLIRDNDQDFAKAIADASQGGFDLDAASKALDHRDRPRARTAERNGLADALAKVSEAQRCQQAIDREAHRLADLQARHAQARDAAAHLARLERARDHHKADRRCTELADALDAMPRGVAQLRGDERESLDALQAQAADLEDKHREAVDRLAAARQALADTKLSEAGVDADLLRRVRAQARRLGTLEVELHQRRQEADRADVQAKQAQRRLGERLAADQLAAIESVQLAEVSALARKADAVRGVEQALVERQRWLSQDEPAEAHGTTEAQLGDGLAALARWLSAPAPAGHRRLWWCLVAAVGVSIALAALLARLHHVVWLIAAVAGPIIAVLAWRDGPTGNRAGADRDVHRRTFEATRLAPPHAWEADAAGERVQQLAGQLASRRLADERADRLAALAHEQTAAESQRAALHERRDALQQQLGVTLSLDDEWLPLLVANLQTWQRESGLAAAAANVAAELAREHREMLSAVNQALAAYDYAPACDADTASQAVEELAERKRQLDAARQAQRTADRDVADASERLEAVRHDHRSLLDRLGLRDEEAPTVDDWLALRPRFVQLQGELQTERALRDRLAAELRDHAGLLALDLPTMEQEIEAQRGLTEQRDELTRQISTIENDITRTKQGHELGDALEARDEATAELARARDENRAAVVGAMLTDWVRREAVQRARPEVFRRASELLVRVTHGSLQLEVADDDASPAFLARSAGGALRPITELSLGERVQTLMAVRLAFMEQDEPAALPLILDEVLGATDDARAAAVIDTVIEAARAGRQVFCFTAQHDEAGKWIARLRDADVPHRVIDLAQVRGRSAADHRPMELAAVPRAEPPEPGERDWEAYGQLLNVPGIDPLHQSAAALHPWHVVHDARALHQLLRLGISTWGQLRTLLEHGGAGVLPQVNGALKHAPAAAAAIETACAAWRVGRGRPVDRAALQDSGCVSDAFIDEVASLAGELEGDAASLLDALETKRVARWQQRNTDRLREHFIEQGCLSEEPPLPPDALRARVLAAAADDVQAGRLSVEWIDRVVHALSQ